MTKALIVNEYHLKITSDGKYWSNGVIDYNFFRRYLDVFDEVFVAIRSSKKEKREVGFDNLCSGEKVTFLDIPEFSGLKGYVKNYYYCRKLIKEYCRKADCAIIRVPNALSFQFLKNIDGKIPYALEVAVDPWTWLAPGNYDSIISPVMRISWTFLLKMYCMRADGVAYVTKKYLQKRYPCKALRYHNGFTASYSTVSIESHTELPPKRYIDSGRYNLIHVSNAFTTYSKGHKECIDIVKMLNSRGYDTTLKFVGDGKLRGEFERYVIDKDVGDKIIFVGRVSDKEEMFKLLREADLLLFPTHSEGLPRVIIESMSVGTPIIATNVGGIPELIEKEYSYDVGDVEGMTDACADLLTNERKMYELSKRCLKRAEGYHEDKLQMKRRDFYSRLKALIE